MVDYLLSSPAAVYMPPVPFELPEHIRADTSMQKRWRRRRRRLTGMRRNIVNARLADNVITITAIIVLLGGV